MEGISHNESASTSTQSSITVKLNLTNLDSSVTAYRVYGSTSGGLSCSTFEFTGSGSKTVSLTFTPLSKATYYNGSATLEHNANGKWYDICSCTWTDSTLGDIGILSITSSSTTVSSAISIDYNVSYKNYRYLVTLYRSGTESYITTPQQTGSYLYSSLSATWTGLQPSTTYSGTALLQYWYNNERWVTAYTEYFSFSTLSPGISSLVCSKVSYTSATYNISFTVPNSSRSYCVWLYIDSTHQAFSSVCSGSYAYSVSATLNNLESGTVYKGTAYIKDEATSTYPYSLDFQFETPLKLETFYWYNATKDATIKTGCANNIIPASSWNKMCKTINALLKKAKLSELTFTEAVTGLAITAKQYNLVVVYMRSIMLTTGYWPQNPPNEVKEGDPIYASMFQGSGSIKEALNFLIGKYT